MVECGKKVEALCFIKGYATSHQFFTGGDILEAYRAAGYKDPEGGWRNSWAALIKEGARNDWFFKAGRVVPTSKQSHTGTLTQWQSRLFMGAQSLVGRSANGRIEELRKSVVLRELSLRDALWKAFDLGVEYEE